MSLRTLRIVALGSLLSLAASGCGIAYREAKRGVLAVKDSELFWRGRHGALTPQEQEWAKAAWTYFDRNYRPETGLVDSVERYPSASMWNAGDALAALVAARELGIIDARTFDERLSRLLDFLNTMPLFEGRLPNRAYDTQSGAMVNYDNQPGAIGWSAVDLGRLLIWLEIVKARYPEYSEYVDKAVLRWSFCDVVDRCGTLWGGVPSGDGVAVFQEGRLGYEQYAARGYQAWGFETRDASDPQPIEEVRIYDVLVPYDARDPLVTGVQAAVVTAPYVLDGLEFGWRDSDGRDDAGASQRAEIVYVVQERRWQRDRVLTARTDHLLSKPPYFVWDAIYVGGVPWHTVTDTGQAAPDAALVSTRAAFGLWALWRTPYTDELMAAVEQLYDPERGWLEGRHERTGGHEPTLAASTNALVLEALFYKVDGRLYRPSSGDDYAETVLRDEFRRPRHCFPIEREPCE